MSRISYCPDSGMGSGWGALSERSRYDKVDVAYILWAWVKTPVLRKHCLRIWMLIKHVYVLISFGVWNISGKDRVVVRSLSLFSSFQSTCSNHMTTLFPELMVAVFIWSSGLSIVLEYSYKVVYHRIEPELKCYVHVHMINGLQRKNMVANCSPTFGY